jgi:capsular exopolysaccharide synthesis family protein
MLTNVNDIFLTGEQAEEELGVPVLGLLPQIDAEGLRLIKNTHSFHPMMEAYRTLRTQLYFGTLDGPARTLLVASSFPAEGKSTVVANLAMALALDNKKVIILDADLRRPALHKLFEVSPSPGLTDVLVGTHTRAEVLRETAEPLVRLVPVGGPPPNPTELLGSPPMRALLEEASDLCDVVLLDSPPLLPVADSLVLAHRVDGVLLVIGEQTLRRYANKAMSLLSRARANVVGTAFNQLQGELGTAYYYRYYVPGTAETPEGDAPEGPPNGDAAQGA